MRQITVVIAPKVITTLFESSHVKSATLEDFVAYVIGSDVSELDFYEPSRAELDIYQAEPSRDGQFLETS